MNNYLPTPYQSYIYKSRYARFLWEEKRRENWDETIDRYFNFFVDKIKRDNKFDLLPFRQELEEAILTLQVMPSMRCLMAAGKALEKENIAGYNCSYLSIDSIKAFSEALYVLMCFHPDTLVKTKDGDKKISELKYDDLILSYDELNNVYEYISPSNIVCTPSEDKQKIEIELENGAIIKCTADHKFLTTNRGWVEAQDLTEYDDIKNYHEI